MDHVALGMVGTTTPDEPDPEMVRCVPKAWVIPSKFEPRLIWDDSGAAGKKGSVWAINSLQLMGVVPSHEKPTGAFFEMWSKRFMASEAPKTPNPAVMLLTNDPRLNLPPGGASSSSSSSGHAPLLVSPMSGQGQASTPVGRASVFQAPLGSPSNPVGRASVFQAPLGSPSNPVGRPSVFNPNLGPPPLPSKVGPGSGSYPPVAPSPSSSTTLQPPPIPIGMGSGSHPPPPPPPAKLKPPPIPGQNAPSLI